MATRSKTDTKREQLKAALRQRCASGVLAAGKPVPSVRDLSLEFNLSKDVVAALLRDLIDEGLLYTVPRVGTFVGRPVQQEAEFYLLVARDGSMEQSHYGPLRIGFEDRLAHHGGIPIVMEWDAALAHAQSGELPPLRGVLDIAYKSQEECWAQAAPHCPQARVRFHTTLPDSLNYDEISFNDFEGGRQATRHLIQAGHKRIAFLALHSPLPNLERLVWSTERESGWLAALTEADLEPAGLALYPSLDAENDVVSAEGVARTMARHLKSHPDITAVVAANDRAAFGLLQGLREFNVPPYRWPAVIGFDNDPTLSKNLFSSLRLPWEEVGRAAADLLWARAHGQFEGHQHHRVPMRLIPRLTSRPNWSQTPGHAALATAL